MTFKDTFYPETPLFERNNNKLISDNLLQRIDAKSYIRKQANRKSFIFELYIDPAKFNFGEIF